MTYSIDLRARVVAYVRGGGSKSEAARMFKVSRVTVYDWLSRGDDLSPKRYSRTRYRKLDWEALSRDVEQYPDAFLKERARRFGVHVSSIGYALSKLRVTHKANNGATGKDG